MPHFKGDGSMSQLVTIFGGSGFVGRYITRHMAKQGWRVRVATRRPNESLFVKPYGAVGQVEPVLANVRDDDSVRAALAGADAVVNCVGTFDKGGRNGFDKIHEQGAERIARIAAQEGVARMVHLSAIGANPQATSLYAASKGRGENAILAHMPGAVILRPSVIFGTEDKLFNRFATMARRFPVLPLVGAGTLFQPVYVDDVARAAVAGVLGSAQGGIYELGGPDVQRFDEMMKQMLDVIHRRAAIVNLPFFLAKPMAQVMELGQILSLGLVPASITCDQLRQLAEDNTVHEGASGFTDLGITPAAMGAIMPDYLWCFRPSGQYAAIKNSARNLRAR